MSDGHNLRRVPSDDRTREYFRGCLLGGAVGDALGSPVNSMSRAAIITRFGELGIRDYVPAFDRLGAITSHTQMSLFTAEGMLRGWVRFKMRGLGPVFASTTGYAYVRWLLTQGYKPQPSALLGETGWLMSNEDLFGRRSPEKTCISALRAFHHGGDLPRNDSKGSAAMTRVAPVGMFMSNWIRRDEAHVETTFKLGAEIAAITHGHPTAHLSAGAFALIIALMLNGATLPEALRRSKVELRRRVRHEETLEAIEAAEDLARTNANAPDAACKLGLGGLAEEALAMALYCTMCAHDFESGTLLAVNHDGASDSTGAVAGNLLGCRYGLSQIPKKWLTPLELRGVVEDAADDLATAPDWNLGYEDPLENSFYNQRYPPN